MKSFAELKSLVQDLHGINARRVYSELLIIAIVSWGCYFALFFHIPMNIKVILFFISAIAFYRGLSFIHEVSHFDRILPKFKLIYNTLFGVPYRVPSYSLTTHNFHHGIKTFGSIQDPEYEKWTERKKIFLLRPFILSFIYPLALTTRFVLIPLLFPFMNKKLQRSIHQKISSFVMNLKYLRPYSEEDFQEMKIQDISCAIYFLAFTTLTLYFGVFKLAYGIWYAQITFISLMNTYRALVAHRYQVHRADPEWSAREMQVNDSVTIEGSFLTEIWAPIGLRYHSTHHMFPSIPYYNLGKAHRRIKTAISKDHPYSKTIEPNFITALSKLALSCR
jgi:fatty acid desaturase